MPSIVLNNWGLRLLKKYVGITLNDLNKLVDTVCHILIACNFNEVFHLSSSPHMSQTYFVKEGYFFYGYTEILLISDVHGQWVFPAHYTDC